MPSRIRRVDSSLDEYIRGLRTEIAVRTGKMPTETEVSRLLPKMLPPFKAVIIIDRGKRKKSHQVEADISILRP